MTDKVQEAQDACIEVVAQASARIMTGGPIPNITPAFDALISATRADTKAKCEAAVRGLAQHVCHHEADEMCGCHHQHAHEDKILENAIRVIRNA